MAPTVDGRSALDAFVHIPSPMRDRTPASDITVNVQARRPPSPALERALSNVGIRLQDDLIRAICEDLEPYGLPRPAASGPASMPRRRDTPATGVMALSPTPFAPQRPEARIAPAPARPASRDENAAGAPHAGIQARRIRARALRDRENEARRLAALAVARTRRSIREEGAERLQVLERAMRNPHLDRTMVTYRGCERMIVSWWMAAEQVKREGKLSLMKLAKYRAEQLRWGPPLPHIDEPDPTRRALKQKELARAGLKKVRYLEREGGPWHKFVTAAALAAKDDDLGP